jgi:hypothetical protein
MRGFVFLSCTYDGRKLFVSLYTGRTEKGQFYARGFKPVDKLSYWITRSPWSPIIYKGGYRKTENFLFSDWCILDFDKDLRLEDAMAMFGHYVHIIAPTRRHDPQGTHRFRLCIPWEKRIENVDVFKSNMKALINKYKSDQKAKDGGRGYFPSRTIFSISATGSTMPFDPDPPPPWRPKKASRWRDGVLPPTLEKMLRRPAPVEGEVNNTLYCLACEFAKSTNCSGDEIRSYVRHLIFPNPGMERNYMTTIESALKRYR